MIPSGERRQARNNRLLLLALWVVFYGSFTLLSPPLLDDADSVHAEVAREMLLRHDWVTLYANGIRYLEKAPLFYWAMAACMRIFGATAAASRLPLAFAVGGLTLVLESFGRRAFASLRAGFYAGLVTLSSFGIFIFSRINIPDVFVCCLLTIALLAYLHLELEHAGRGSRLLCYTFAVACALDVLTKGLIGIVFPIAIVAAHLLLTRGGRGAWARLRALRPLESAAVFLAIATPWHVLAGFANPAQGHPGSLTFSRGHFSVPLPTDGNVHGWTWFYFINEQVLRYLNLRVPRDYDTVPLALFLGLIFVWLMPWSVFLPTALLRALPIRKPAWRKRFAAHTLAPADKIRLLLIVWAVIPLVFFTFSTRQEYYVLPALPAMILLIAAMLAESSHPVMTFFTQDTMRRISLILLAVGSLLSAACLIFLIHTQAPAPTTDLAGLLQQNPADYALSFGHFLDLNAQALGYFRLPLWLTAISLFVGPLAHLVLRRIGRPHAAVLALAASAFLFLLASHIGLRIFSPTLTSAQLAKAVGTQVRPQDMVAIHGEYEAGSTMGFYLRRRDLHLVEGRSSNLWYGSFFADAPAVFETRESMVAKWRGPQRIFLWQDPSDRKRPPLPLPQPVYVLVHLGGKEILSNQPNR